MEDEMMNMYVIPANVKYYDVCTAFLENKEIDWTQQRDFEVGDYIYIYLGDPYQKIAFLTEVTEVNVPFADSIDDSKYWTDPTERKDKNQKFVRLKLIYNFLKKDGISYSELKEKGLRGNIQGVRKVYLDSTEPQFKWGEYLLHRTINMMAGVE